MQTFKFDDLANTYDRFQHPRAVIEVNGKNLADERKGFPVSDIVVDLTSGFEASTAEFSIYDVFDKNSGSFLFEKVKKYILLGSGVEVFLGYGGSVRSVFVGAITRVNFLFEEEHPPCIRVTAMDVKGIMMSGSYARQLKAMYYSDAVREILEKTAYEKLKSRQIIRDVVVTDTPDKQRSTTGGQGLPGMSGSGGGFSPSAGGLAGGVSGDGAADTDRSIEMVAESDYEFVVKAAKKNNYEFYTECGVVYFRKAKSDTKTLISIGPGRGLRSLDIAYDITGLVEKVIARGTDAGKAKVITAKQKRSGKLSKGNKANALLKGSQKVFLDPSITSKEEAEERARSLTEEMSYRLGSLSCDTVGLPELHPGHFISMQGLGTAADNLFYLNRVRHVLDEEGTFVSELSGSASSIEQETKLPGLGLSVPGI